MHASELISLLQSAIGPVIVISGIGLLLLSITNRYGRIIDRSRLLSDRLKDAEGNIAENLKDQVAVMYRRARMIRLSIIYSTVSILLISLLIIAQFVIALFKLDLVITLALLFTGAMVTLIISLVYFIIDINISLWALDIELGPGQKL